jgi:hypothetical protein
VKTPPFRCLALTMVLLAGCAWNIKQPYKAITGLRIDDGVVVGGSLTGRYADSQWSIERDGAVVASGRCSREHLAFALMNIQANERPVGVCFSPDHAEVFAYDDATNTVWIADLCSSYWAPPFWKELLADYYEQSPHFSSYEECGPDSKLPGFPTALEVTTGTRGAA